MIATSPAANLSFTRDFRGDFDVLLKAFDGPPFAFARFADGEAALLRGDSHTAKSDGWRASGGAVPNLVDGLRQALECELPGWHLGITAASHHPTDHVRLLHDVQLPDSRVTFAELFIFANWGRAAELLPTIPRVRVVGHRATAAFGERGFDIPPDATADPEFDIEPALDWMLTGHGPILLSAGPVAKWLAFEYWWSTSPTLPIANWTRYSCVDVGSAISPLLRGGKPNRTYQRKGSDLREWVPEW